MKKLTSRGKLLLSLLTLLVSNIIFSQKVIRGSVSSETGQALPQVSVIASGSSAGTVTDGNSSNQQPKRYYQMISMKSIFIWSLFILQTGCFNISANSSYKKISNEVTILPEVYDKAFANPLKGFRAGTVRIEEYPTLTRLYIKWNEIENSENDGVDKIINFCNKKWVDLPKNNIKVIPRVYLEWPYNAQNSSNTRDTVTSSWGDTRYVDRFWPADLRRGDYSSDQFKERLVKLIAKLGKAWDKDPRVAYIEMGLIGWWGEQHTPLINDDMQKLIGDAFIVAFKTKLVMVRQAKDFASYPFGSYWDSFAHAFQRDEATTLVALGDKWKTSIRGGEVAYDWGDLNATGANPNESLSNKWNRDYLIDYIRKVHCNHLGWVNNYDTTKDGVVKGAAEVQKNLGYRFIINEVRYTRNVLPNSNLSVSFSVCNIGSSPFYYNWPVEVSLLNIETRQPVWKEIFKNVNIRKWLPGDKWDTLNRNYEIIPERSMVNAAFKLPENFQKGEYILALSILDPAGNLPAVRFATANYFKGGRHPIGKIGIDKALDTFELKKEIFDDLFSDRTLHYIY